MAHVKFFGGESVPLEMHKVRIVQKLNLQVTSFTRKSRKYSSYKGKVGKISPNRMNRRFNTNIPHQKITTDTSEFKYYEVDQKGRMLIKKLLKKHKYPPEGMEDAVQTVMTQCELWTDTNDMRENEDDKGYRVDMSDKLLMVAKKQENGYGIKI